MEPCSGAGHLHTHKRAHTHALTHARRQIFPLTEADATHDLIVSVEQQATTSSSVRACVRSEDWNPRTARSAWICVQCLQGCARLRWERAGPVCHARAPRCLLLGTVSPAWASSAVNAPVPLASCPSCQTRDTPLLPMFQ